MSAGWAVDWPPMTRLCPYKVMQSPSSITSHDYIQITCLFLQPIVDILNSNQVDSAFIVDAGGLVIGSWTRLIGYVIFLLLLLLLLLPHPRSLGPVWFPQVIGDGVAIEPREWVAIPNSFDSVDS